MNHRYCLFLLIIMGSLSLLACEKSKEGKVMVTEQEFFLRQDSSHAYVVDARGKVQNIGDADVKRVVLTGECMSCDEALAPGRWMGPGEERTEDQKDMINYLSVGEKADFEFRGVAFIYQLVPEPPTEIPDGLQVIIESFETVN